MADVKDQLNNIKDMYDDIASILDTQPPTLDPVEHWIEGSDGKRVQLPVNPPANDFTSTFEYEDYNVEGIGEVTNIKRRNLREFNITSFYPVFFNPTYCKCELTMTPREFYNQLENWRNARKPIRYITTGLNGFNIEVTIRDIQATFDMFGNPGDLYYTITFKEYRAPKITVQDTTKNASTSTNKNSTSKDSNKGTASSRPASTSKGTTSTTNKNHTVMKNESLWVIAKKYYGDGNQWQKIYNANKKTIGSNPNKIQPGMKLVIPK